ncbi:MAG: hypothetical protein PHV61_03550 [Limnochordia bacterium]|nr:hypothetical protein [Limnochordia bacterium]
MGRVSSRRPVDTPQSVGGADLKGPTSIAILVFAVVLASLPCGRVLAATDSIEVEFQGQVIYQFKQDLLYIDGGVQIRYGHVTIAGQRLLVNLADNWIRVEGTVLLILPAGEAAGEKLYYDLNSGVWSLSDAQASIVLPESNGSVYLSGERFDGDNDRLVVVKGAATTCSQSQPHYHLAAKKLEIYPGSHLIIRNVVYKEGNIPLFYWPYLRLPISKEASLYLPEIGRTAVGGWFIGCKWYYQLDDYLSGLLIGQYHQLTGVVLGATGYYALGKAHNGQLLIEYRQSRITNGGQLRGGFGHVLEYGPVVLGGNMERNMNFVRKKLSQDILQADFMVNAVTQKISANVGTVYKLTKTRTTVTERLRSDVKLSFQPSGSFNLDGSMDKQTNHAGGSISSNSVQADLNLSRIAQMTTTNAGLIYKLKETKTRTTARLSSDVKVSSQLGSRFDLNGSMEKQNSYSSNILQVNLDLRGVTPRTSATFGVKHKIQETKTKTMEQLAGDLELSGRLDSRWITNYQGSYRFKQSSEAVPTHPEYQIMLTKSQGSYRAELLFEHKLNPNGVTETCEYVSRLPELSLTTRKLEHAKEWPHEYTLRLGRYRVEPGGTEAIRSMLELNLSNKPYQLTGSTRLVLGSTLGISIYSLGTCYFRINPRLAFHWYPCAGLSTNSVLQLQQAVGESPLAFERVSSSQSLTSQLAYTKERVDWSLCGGYDLHSDRFQNVEACLELRDSPERNDWTLGLSAVFDPYRKRMMCIAGSFQDRIDHEQNINLEANYNLARQRVDRLNARINIKFGNVWMQAGAEIPRLKGTNISFLLRNTEQEHGWKVGLSGVFNPYINALVSVTGLLEKEFAQEQSIRIGVSHNILKRRLDAFDVQLKIRLGDTWRLVYSGIYRGYEDKWHLGDFTLVKDLHCRELALRYNQIEDMFWMEYRIHAFPQEKLKFGITGEQFMFDAEGWEDLLLEKVP